MKRPFILTFTACMLFGVQAFSQEKKPFYLRALHAVKTYIDSSAVKGIDHRYIQVPEKPWALVLKYNVNDMYLRNTAYTSAAEMAERGIDGDMNWESTFKPHAENSIGLWVGYRGYGFGYSYSLQKSKGRNFSIGATGANYGFNLRLRRFYTNEIEANYSGHDGDEVFSENEVIETWDDIKVKSAIFDAYYMFNGKHFSYAAAYDQSNCQIRSAGSLMLGIMWFQTSIDYTSRNNALFLQILDNVGRIKVHEGSIGIGYAYNWVPFRNMLVNVTAMPTLSLYKRCKTDYYESNYDVFLEEGEVSPKGKKVVPDDLSWQEDITLEHTGSDVQYGKISLNLDARVSLTYNFNRCFLNVYGQYNNYKYNFDDNRVRLSDWYVNASLGWRF